MEEEVRHDALMNTGADSVENTSADSGLDTNSSSVPVDNGVHYDESRSEFVYGSKRYKMVYVEGGSFDMGATAEQMAPYGCEKPVHRVTLSGYYIGQTAVPQWLWVAVMGNNPSRFKGDNLPVEMVSRIDCRDFMRKLNALTGRRFRLPTEAQWEYAARGGNKSCGYQYSGSDNFDEVAWYNGNCGGRPHEVGTKLPNELGLYDMSGNVFEWCDDWHGEYSDNSVTDPLGPTYGECYEFRGGSWFSSWWHCRVAFRDGGTPGYRDDAVGFRLALPGSTA